jgi:hypothetical protein
MSSPSAGPRSCGGLASRLMDRPILQRLVLDFRDGELVVRCLYRSQDGAGPSTKTRTREVTALVRTGLEQALEAFDSESGAECVGTSGFTTREDVLLATTSPVSEKLMRKGA